MQAVRIFFIQYSSFILVSVSVVALSDHDQIDTQYAAVCLLLVMAFTVES